MNKFHTKYYYQKQLEVNYASREKEKNNPHEQTLFVIDRSPLNP